jgi:AraC-like DNA-binding protein
LQAIFRKQEGLSPGEFITRQRMAAAEGLLRDQSLSLRAISERLGYANERHFSTAFRRYHGQPPGRFRLSQTDH